MNLVARLIRPFDPAEGPPPQAILPFMRWALRGAERAILLAFAVTFVTGISELVAARFTGWVIDQTAVVEQGAFWETFWPVVIVGVAFFLVIRPLIFVMDAGVTSILLGPNLYPMVLARLNQHTLGHSMQFFENDFAGRLSQKALQTARALTDLVIEVSDVVVYSVAMFIGAFILMLMIDARLLLVFVVWAVFYAAALRYFIPRVQKRSKARAGARTQVTGQVVDIYSNIAAVKLFARDADEDSATRAALDAYRDRSLEFGTLSAVFRMVLMTLGGVLPLFAILGALWLWSAGSATAGDIAMTAMITTRLSMLTNRLGRVAMSIFTNIGEVEDGIGTLTPEHGITDRPNAQSIVPQGAIRFDAVSFGYGRATQALTDFDLTISEGERVALVGASGAGKSTVVSLLLRLYDVEKGRITLGGTDIRDVTQIALRTDISVVRQETSMFNRSAMENIRYGRPEASEEEVFEAARRASAHSFILGLTDHRGRTGYAAHLGERGVKLSGGQRQRIALARAILKDAPILVLDEATSALDSEVEAEIQSALEQVMQGKTVLAIAHRLSTIASMDRIVVMDDGGIVEVGTHDALLAKGGLYARYWDRQSGGFIGTEAAE
ncbi:MULTISPECIES: ABC transporter ATP-binding protein [Marivita]|uniref:ABC transporter ATP-binding protein n=1 Tax=Marivita cryptomonadis TaxID=505252 RepID=A0A9Q2P024_9RHOB|nr:MULTISPECIES: ABC transporter ATP-binding protein [Marivita]MCR9167503.1 ABC transporter ATP-binding protein/permease [Paracoccaceae bacterium]MBM2321885.1 ABC transporter ATP-binding protein [Marivita cryptomonadis]MBM2331488.1 ABC transporter ATP-binding protein [Marivita cryptomonadis]MBM2341074.1 ABC transporter ATP-binding protein [Marivita cryptomonadis]MBM2345736.1 ABC transporter ATP-binding protein [Marivita cryptomonadis]